MLHRSLKCLRDRVLRTRTAKCNVNCISQINLGESVTHSTNSNRLLETKWLSVGVALSSSQRPRDRIAGDRQVHPTSTNHNTLCRATTREWFLPIASILDNSSSSSHLWMEANPCKGTTINPSAREDNKTRALPEEAQDSRSWREFGPVWWTS
jgi:hypothetical protein